VAGRPDVSAEVAPRADVLLASPRSAARFLALLDAGLDRLLAATVTLDR
jgi:hypothetical protein